MIHFTQILPVILITIDVFAGAVYGFDGDFRKLVYWWAAATLTAAVTF